MQKNNNFPLLGKDYAATDFASVSLAAADTAVSGFDVGTYEGLDNYIAAERLKKGGKKFLYGGYHEQRAIYKSPHFESAEVERSIHLGVDFWAEVGTPIFAPLDGIVHSFRYNDQTLDYGATLILQHMAEGSIFYSLYGHLSLSSIANKTVGQVIKAGETIAWFGNRSENGGWSPHLHLQMIVDMGDAWGDYAGVSSVENAPFYLKNCPNPLFLSVVL